MSTNHVKYIDVLNPYSGNWILKNVYEITEKQFKRYQATMTDDELRVTDCSCHHEAMMEWYKFAGAHRVGEVIFSDWF